jgi:hypothetical protein
LGHRQTILHINLLRKWEERVKTINVITTNEDLVDGEGEILDSMGIAKEPKTFNVGGHLSNLILSSYDITPTYQEGQPEWQCRRFIASIDVNKTLTVDRFSYTVSDRL